MDKQRRYLPETKVVLLLKVQVSPSLLFATELDAEHRQKKSQVEESSLLPKPPVKEEKFQALKLLAQPIHARNIHLEICKRSQTE